MWQDYQVANDVFKTTKTMTLWKAENGLVEVAQSTLAVPIKSSEKIRGYLFHGQGKLLLDAIVETRNGAIGKSIEKELNKPFLTVENAEQIQANLASISDEDLSKMGYRSTQEFLEKAKELLDRSRLRGKLHGIHWCGGLSDSMFAFSNETDSPDILLVNGSKIVYSASNMTFVSSDGRSILKSPEHVAVSDHGRCCVVCK